MIIFICISIGVIVFFKAVISYIHNQYQPTTEKKITKGLLSMPFWQILFSGLVCAYALEVEPVYKQTDEDVSSFLQEYSEVGDLVSEYTGINGYSNFNYLMSESQSLHTYATIFIVVVVIIALVIAVGAISKRLDRRIVEGLAILSTLVCCWIAKSSTDLYEAIIRDGATLQTIAWIGRLFGTDIYSAMDMMIRSIWLLPIILIIKHFYYHKTLNEYYALSVPKSEPIKEDNSECLSNIQQTEPGDENIPESEEQPEPIVKHEENIAPTEEVATIKEKQKQSPRLEVSQTKESASKPSVPFNLLFGIGLVILMGLVVLWILKSNEKETPIPVVENRSKNTSVKDVYEQRSNEIIQELTSRYGDKISVQYKYPELSKYCAFSLTGNETEYLLIYDLEQGILRRFENYNLQTTNAGEVCLPYYSLSMNEDNDRIMIQGNNGANSIGYSEYILELNPLDWTVREICSGREVTRLENGYKVNRIIMTKWVTCNADSEYASIDIYYDLNGKLIPSPGEDEVYTLSGKIDNKYAITMSLSIKTNGIYGTYYYNRKGSDSKLYLYGGASRSKDIVLLEFTDDGQQTGIFKGRLTSRTLEGTFANSAGVEMSFELLPIASSSANSNGSQSSDNISANADMPDRDIEFPGGMIGFGQYITDNLQYPDEAKEKGISGNVRVSFIIDKDGSVIDAKVIESVDPNLDKEAIRLIRSMPKWKPGIRNGKYVKMRTNTVIRFKLK